MAGQVFNVSGGGSALNDCMQSLPSGESKADPHIIYVAPGTYDPIQQWTLYRNVMVIATGGRAVTFIDGDNANILVRKTQRNGSYVLTFVGFTLKNGYVEVSEDDCAANYTWFDSVGYYTTFIDCRITNCVHVNTGTLKTMAQSRTHLAMSCTFRNCEIDHNTTNNIGWRYCSFIGCDIHHNTMNGTNGDGYSFDGIYRCKFHDNLCMTYTCSMAWCSLFYDNDCRYLFERPNQLINNVFYRNNGVLIDNFGGQSQQYNNIFFGNTPACTAAPSNTVLFNLYNSGTTTRACNNLMDCTEAQFTRNSRSNWAEYSGNVFGISDPFVDAANLDFHLKPGSVAIGAAILDVYSNTTPINLRENGNWRTFDSGFFNKSAPSCGAFEYSRPALLGPSALAPIGNGTICQTLDSNS